MKQLADLVKYLSGNMSLELSNYDLYVSLLFKKISADSSKESLNVI